MKSKQCSVLFIALVCLYAVDTIAVTNVAKSTGSAAVASTTKTATHQFDLTNTPVSNLVLPTDVVVSKSRVYVVDSGNDRVVVYKKNGRYLFSFGKRGDSEEELNNPVGIGADIDGRIYVADTGNHRIQIFDENGIYGSSISLSSNGLSIRPIDVAVNPANGSIFVTGNNNHQVMVYNKNGKFVRSWGGNGADQGMFRYPATIAVTSGSRLAVVDVLNTRAQLFQEKGEFLVQIGQWGVLPGKLYRPKGIAVDQNGDFYISDSFMNQIQVFDDTGKFLYLVRVNDSNHKLTTPTGIALDGRNLYVVEMLKHKVSVFQMD